MIWLGKDNGKLEQEVQKLVKEEVGASSQNKNRLRRWISKRDLNESRAITAALSKYIETSEDHSQELISVLVDRLKASTTEADELTRCMDILFTVAVKCKRLHLFDSTTWQCSSHAINSALSLLIHEGDLDSIDRILLLNLQPGFLNMSNILGLIRLEASIFTRLHAKNNFNHENLQFLCTKAAEEGNSVLLCTILKELAVASSRNWNQEYRLSRDGLLITALTAGNYHLLKDIAGMLPQQPLADLQPLQAAVQAAQMGRCILLAAIQPLFQLFELPLLHKDQSHVEYAFRYCVDAGDIESLSVMIRVGLYVPAMIIKSVCENSNLKVLDELLKGNIVVTDDIWLYYNSLPGSTADIIREKLLTYMLEGSLNIPSKEQALQQTVMANQIHLVSRLVSSGASVDHNEGETLRIAVLSSNIDIIRLLVSRKINLVTFETGLRATDRISGAPRGQITRLLLDSAPDFQTYVIDDIILRIVCDTSVEVNLEILDALLKRSRTGLQSKMQAEQMFHPATIAACLRNKKGMQIRMKAKCAAIPYEEQQIEKALFQMDLLSQEFNNEKKCCHDQNIDPEETALDSTELLPNPLSVRLLKKHIKECGNYIAGAETWPLDTIILLANRISSGTLGHHEVYQCMSIAIQHGQREVFRELLKWVHFSQEEFQTLPCEIISVDKEYVDIVFGHLLEANADAHDLASAISMLFQRACAQQQFEQAAYISLKCSYKLGVGLCIEHLKTGISATTDVSSFQALLENTTTTQHELGELWTELFRVRPPNLESKARMLLQVGYDGADILQTIYNEVVSGSDSAVITAILDSWQIEKSADLRSTFNYNSQCEIQPQLASSGRSQDKSYYQTLAWALSGAIRAQRSDLCRMLFGRGAPLVFEGKSLITEAIECGNPASLSEDHVLCVFLHAKMFHPDFQAVLDFSLLQAVKCGRHSLVRGLIKMGAESCAYNNECWHLAMTLGSTEMFKSLLSSKSSQKHLSQIFDQLFAEVTFPVDDIDRKCTIISQLHEADFTDTECFSRALVVLSLSGVLTPSRIDILLQCGASVDFDKGRCMNLALLNGSVDEFILMFYSCQDEEVRESLFIQIFQRLSERGPSRLFESNSITSTIRVLQAMLFVKVQQRHLNEALRLIARDALLDRDSIYPLGLLLRKGAQFEDDAAEMLAKVLLLEESELTSLVAETELSIDVRKRALLAILHPPLADFDLSKPAWTENPSLIPFPGAIGIKVPHSVVSDVINQVLMCEDQISASQVDDFFNRIEVDSSLEVCYQECAVELEVTLTSFIGGLEQNPTLKPNRMELISTILKWLQLYGQSWFCCEHFSSEVYSLHISSLHGLLFICSEQGYTPIVKQLLELEIDPNITSSEGKSPLFLAAEQGHVWTADALIASGAQPNDGSLHIALCKQHPIIIDRLLNAAHSPIHRAEAFGDATPLKAFIDYEHKDPSLPSLKFTMFDFLKSMHSSVGVEGLMTEISSVIESVLTSTCAYQLLVPILMFFEQRREISPHLCEAEFEIEGYTYSIVGLIRKWKRVCLSTTQKEEVALRFQKLGVKSVLYATEGDQPSDAENIPERFLRKIAFETKECAICMDQPGNEWEIHAGLAPACITAHGWDDDIICSDCLQTYLTTKMFPHDDERVRYKFPATNVPCWAEQCKSTILPHNVLQELIDPDLFVVYDTALCQQTLNSGTSMVKCATPDCAGAFWHDPADDAAVANEKLTIFACPICFDNTCMECNDLYEKHDNRPCPVGLEAKKDERVKEEEKLSESALKNEKRCPKCNLMYEKYYGCDHIVCGKNVYDARVDKGCRYEFCNLCLGAWPYGHTATCILHGHEYL